MGFCGQFLTKEFNVIFTGDAIIGQVLYYPFRSQLCSIEDNGSPPAVFDDTQTTIY